MKDVQRLLWLAAGLGLGVLGVMIYQAGLNSARAANDRYEDYILCTGLASTNPRSPSDGVWLLDSRSGKLLGTVVDRDRGTIGGWAEVDLASEFGVAPQQNMHFVMTTGQINRTQAALYVAETASGKFGVYTLGPRNDGQPGLMIHRHDLVLFRQPPAKAGH